MAIWKSSCFLHFLSCLSVAISVEVFIFLNRTCSCYWLLYLERQDSWSTWMFCATENYLAEDHISVPLFLTEPQVLFQAARVRFWGPKLLSDSSSLALKCSSMRNFSHLTCPCSLQIILNCFLIRSSMLPIANEAGKSRGQETGMILIFSLWGHLFLTEVIVSALQPLLCLFTIKCEFFISGLQIFASIIKLRSS